MVPAPGMGYGPQATTESRSSEERGSGRNVSQGLGGCYNTFRSSKVRACHGLSGSLRSARSLELQRSGGQQELSLGPKVPDSKCRSRVRDESQGSIASHHPTVRRIISDGLVPNVDTPPLQ